MVSIPRQAGTKCSEKVLLLSSAYNRLINVSEDLYNFCVQNTFNLFDKGLSAPPEAQENQISIVFVLGH